MSSVSEAAPQAAERRQGSLGLKVVPAATLIAALMFLPSLVTYLFVTSSHAPGTALACVLTVAVLLPSLKLDRVLALVAMLALAIMFHLFVADLFEEVDFGRSLLSLLLVGIMIAACSCVGDRMLTLSDEVLNSTLVVLTVVMIVIALAGIAEVQPSGISIQIFGFSIGGYVWPKSVFPYTEPSHFALGFVPLLIFACVKSPVLIRYALLAIGLAVGYFLQNLTLVAGVVVAAAVSLPIAGLVAGGVALAAGAASIDIAYFSDRLDFSASTANLSTLIYIQGWELVADSFHRTHAWGVGFQQLGLGPVNSAAADAIFRLGHFELNLQDGGFTAAKLIGEFGVIGMALVGLCLFLAAKLSLRLRRIARRREARSSGAIYAYSIICAFSLDLFVRGVGYFNGSALLFVCALFYYFRHDRGRARAPGDDLGYPSA